MSTNPASLAEAGFRLHTTTNTMSQRPALSRCLVLALLALVVSAAPVLAATPSTAAPLFGGYWAGFFEHWGGVFKKQNGIILAVLGLGAVSLFIITRGKWKK